MMKYCKGCDTTKPLEDFHKHTYVRKDGTQLRQTLCKPCHHKHYAKTATEHNKRMRIRNREVILRYLAEHPCEICGEIDPVCLEFDHIDPNQKLYCVSTFSRHARKVSKLEAEIAKCRVLCANCHRRETAKQFGYRSKIAANI